MKIQLKVPKLKGKLGLKLPKRKRQPKEFNPAAGRLFPGKVKIQVTRHKEAKGKIHRKTLLVFLFGIAFLACAIALYELQYLIPHISSDDKNIVRPDGSVKSSASFKQALDQYNIQFESLEYATQSPTLIVKLPEGAYVYLNTSVDPVSQVKLLNTILSRIAIENKGKPVKYVDLTHEKAIVKF